MPRFTEQFSNHLDKQYFNFAAAHFLIFADGEREPLHGHNYRAELEIATGALDDAALVADFIEVKPVFKAACDLLDHKILIPTLNPLLDVTRDGGSIVVGWGDDVFMFPAADVVLMDIENTSSELLARWLCEATLDRLHETLPGLELRRVEVTLSESPGQAARYERRWAPSSATTPVLRSA